MHELSICNSMVGIVRRYAEGRSVSNRGVVRSRCADRSRNPGLLLVSVEVSELAGVELPERVPAKIRCARCGRNKPRRARAARDVSDATPDLQRRNF